MYSRDKYSSCNYRKSKTIFQNSQISSLLLINEAEEMARLLIK